MSQTSAKRSQSGVTPPIAAAGSGSERRRIDPELQNAQGERIAPDDVALSQGFVLASIQSDPLLPSFGTFDVQNLTGTARQCAYTASRLHTIQKAEPQALQATFGTNGGAVVAPLDIAGGGGGVESLTQLIYAPTHPASPLPLGVYTDFNALYQDFLLTQGYVDIYLDPRYGISGALYPPPIPPEAIIFPIPQESGAAAYDLQGRATFLTPITAQACVLYFEENGTEIIGCQGLTGNIVAVNRTAQPVFLVGEYDAFIPEVFALQNGATLQPLTAPVLRLGDPLSASPQSVIGLLNGSINSDPGGLVPAVTIPSNGTGIVFLGYNASIDTNTIGGDGTTAVFAVVSSSNAGTSPLLDGFQAFFTGTLLVDLAQVAQQITYDPANAGDWGSSIPTEIREALDTLAANVAIP